MQIYDYITFIAYIVLFEYTSANSTSLVFQKLEDVKVSIPNLLKKL